MKRMPKARVRRQSLSEAAMSLPNYVDYIEIFVADYLLYRGTCDLLSDSKSRSVRLGDPTFRSRLIVICRLLFSDAGDAFFEHKYSLRIFSIDSNDSMSKEMLSDTVVNGQYLISTVGLISGNGTLVSGDAKDPSSEFNDGNTVIAFYLPQYYPFLENDRWWGDGYTEWSAVTSAEPQFPNHNMPLLPADLGFYDLRVRDVRRRQEQLARSSGVDAFCYYYYWFSGRRLMNTVVDDILSSGTPGMPYCICWANEAWSRRWDGGDKDILINQEHDAKSDSLLINDLIPHFQDPRYITVGGAPILLIYRLSIMKEPQSVFSAWRAAAKDAGFPDLFIAAVRSFGLTKEEAAIVDGVVDFPPHTANASEITTNVTAGGGHSGAIFDYREVVINDIMSASIHHTQFPGIMPRWDNTPRKASSSHIFVNSSPSAFRVWARSALQKAQTFPPDRRFIFVNSWNEWSEGAMLEPDRKFGHGYLTALKQARSGVVLLPSQLSDYSIVSPVDNESMFRYVDSLANEANIISIMAAKIKLACGAKFVSGPPDILVDGIQTEVGGSCNIEYCSQVLPDDSIFAQRGDVIEMSGWVVFSAEHETRFDSFAYMVLMNEVEDNLKLEYHVPMFRWSNRPDVAKHFGLNIDATNDWFGASLAIDCSNVNPGAYSIGFVSLVGDKAVFVDARRSFYKG